MPVLNDTVRVFVAEGLELPVRFIDRVERKQAVIGSQKQTVFPDE